MPAADWVARPSLPSVSAPGCRRVELLAYLEAILRIYNRYGRRDNIHKARIKILVRTLGVSEFTRQVEEEFAASREFAPPLAATAVQRMRGYFAPPPYERLEDLGLEAAAPAGPAPYGAWLRLQYARAQGSRLSDRHGIAQEAR